MSILAYTMTYKGTSIDSKLATVQFEEKYYEEYKNIYNDCFYEMRKALELQPYHDCDSLDALLSKKNDIFLLLINDELVGAVAIYENEVDDLIVAKAFQNQGFGRQLLLFAVNLLQKRNRSPIQLGVVEWNQKAISLYKKNGFIVSKIETVT